MRAIKKITAAKRRSVGHLSNTRCRSQNCLIKFPFDIKFPLNPAAFGGPTLHVRFVAAVSWADTAMYQAKALGRNTYACFTSVMNTAIKRRLAIEAQMHVALEKNEFELYFQPKCDAKTLKIIEAEALLRWNNSVLGKVMPDEFIPLADHPENFKDFEITEKYFQLLEEQIRDKPEYYLWSHKRWKHAKN
jgi:hypothetical protein